MKNCPKCNRKISKKYHFEYKRKNSQEDPIICKTCQKLLDLSLGKRTERTFDTKKTRFFEVHNMVRTSNIGILEKIQVNP